MKWATHEDITSARKSGHIKGLKLKSTFEGRALKATDEDKERHRAALSALGIEDDGGRIVPVLIGTNKRARDGHVIHLTGMDVEHYTQRNPVVLWNHDRFGLPIGRAPIVDIDLKAGEMRALAQFASQDVYPAGAMIGEMVARGYIHSPSIGWDTIEAEQSDDADVLQEFPWAMEITRSQLLEFSPVTIEADTYSGFGRALNHAQVDGIDTRPAADMVGRILDSIPLWDHREPLEEIWRAHKGGHTVTVDMGNKPTLAELLDKKVPGLMAKGETASDAIRAVRAEMGEEEEEELNPDASGAGDEELKGEKDRAEGEEEEVPTRADLMRVLREALDGLERMEDGAMEDERRFTAMATRAFGND